MTLEEQLAELCEKHSVTDISISFSSSRGFSAYAHGPVGTCCVSGFHELSGVAVMEAIARLEAHRAAVAAPLELSALRGEA